MKIEIGEDFNPWGPSTEDDDGILTYKDDVQDVFNKWYDYYLNMIEESGE